MRNNKLSKIDVVSVAVGSIIGTGAFLLPGDFFLKDIGLINSIIGILIGIVLVGIIEKNYSYLIKNFPSAGGEYIFVKKIVGNNNAFICGWLLALAYFTIIPLNATALPIVINTVFNNVLKFKVLYNFNGNIYLGEVLVSLIILIVFALLNIKGIKLASIIQNIMVLILVGVVVLFTGSIIIINGVEQANLVTNLSADISVFKVLKVLSVAPFLFIGFDCIPQLAEELNFDLKKVSKLAFFSIALGGLLYISLIILTSYGVTMEMLVTSKINWAAGYSVGLYFGKIGVLLLALAFLMAIVAGINGFYMASSRLIYAMAKEGDLPKIFAKNPINAIILLCVLSLAITLLGRNTVLWSLDVSSVGAALAYFYTSFSTYKLIKSKNNYPKSLTFTAICGIIIGGIFVCLLIVPIFPTALNMGSYMTLVVWIILGIIFKIVGNFKRT